VSPLIRGAPHSAPLGEKPLDALALSRVAMALEESELARDHVPLSARVSHGPPVHTPPLAVWLTTSQLTASPVVTMSSIRALRVLLDANVHLISISTSLHASESVSAAPFVTTWYQTLDLNVPASALEKYGACDVEPTPDPVASAAVP
jgi:hypothetical protein